MKRRNHRTTAGIVIVVMALLAGQGAGKARAGSMLPGQGHHSYPKALLSGVWGGTHFDSPIQFHWPIPPDSLVLIDRALYSSSFCSYVDGDRQYLPCRRIPGRQPGRCQLPHIQSGGYSPRYGPHGLVLHSRLCMGGLGKGRDRNERKCD